MTDWTEFDNIISEDTLSKIAKLDSGEQVAGEYPVIPEGKYEVVPEAIELGTTKTKNQPLLKVKFRIVAGKYDRQMLFANVWMGNHFGIHNAKEFIRKLQPTSPVVFTSYTQWDIYLKGISEEICCKQSYVVDYFKEPDSKDPTKSYDKVEVESGPYALPDTYKAPQPKQEADEAWTQE